MTTEHSYAMWVATHWPEAMKAMADLRAQAALVPELVKALEAIARVLPGADLPGPVYLSIEEKNLVLAALAKVKEERK